MLAAGGVLAGVAVLGVSIGLRPLSWIDAAIRFGLWRDGVKSRYVSVNGVRLHYLEAAAKGGGVGTPVVLVHGLGARGEDWGKIITGLAAAGFHVYVPDLPGYGRSEKPDVGYTMAYEQAAVRGYMQAMRLAHADVIGWSMGGWVAMRLAAEHPEMVDRLVLYDSAGVYFPLEYETSIFTPTDAAGFNTLLARLTPKKVKIPGFLARDFVRRGAKSAWVLQRTLAAMKTGKDLMEFRLAEIKAPTAVLWGAQDELIPPAAGEKIAAGIAGAVFLPIEGCGHLMPVECVSQVLPATIEFLRKGEAESSR